MWISAFTPGGPAPKLQAVLYLAEFYLAGNISLAGVVRQARAGAAEAALAGVDVRFVRAIFAPQDETCFALYQADSAEDVTAAGARAGLVFDRVVEALAFP